MKFVLDAQVIIVGAGPAGVSAAKTLFESGIDVIVIDKSDFPRRKACAGGLMNHVIEEFPYIEQFIDCKVYKLRVFSPDLSHNFSVFDKNKPIMAMSKNRTDFDKQMVEHIKALGVKVLTKEKLVNIENKRDYIEIETMNDNKSKIFKSKVVIGADSAYSTVSKILKIGLFDPELKIDKKKELGMAIEKEILFDNKTINDNLNAEMNAVHLYLHFQGIKGYAWSFPRSTGTNLGLGGLGYQGRKVKKALESFENLMLDREIIPKSVNPQSISEFEVIGGILPATLPYDKLCCDRVVLIGDAAGVCSSATGEGIYYSLKSGQIAGNIISELIGSGKDFSERNLLNYRKTIKNQIGQELKFQYVAKNKVLMDKRRCLKVVRWAQHDEALKDIFSKFLTGQKMYKGLIFKMFYHYVRCKILDKLRKLGNIPDEEIQLKKKI